ncbi:MAG: SIR2 family protein [Planctomycetes bacterium]|nr:SIR2 family protein [Planctomycetota bacterium]
MPHLLLPALAPLLRFATLLTTNFDTLIEDAFSHQGVALNTYPVHLHAGLPRASVMGSTYALVKLHGGRYGLRADHSLDKTPTAEEADHFTEYFTNVAEPSASPSLPMRHCLVMGASGEDARTVRLFHQTVNRLKGKRFRIFWVCYSKRDVDILHRDVKCPLLHHVTTCIHEDLGLLLLHVYQRIRSSLPSAGGFLPFQVTYPPAPYASPHNTLVTCTRAYYDPILRQYAQELVDQLKPPSGTPIASPVVAISGKEGVTSICATAFTDLRRSHICIWLELDLFESVPSMLIGLLDALSHRLGFWASLPVMRKLHMRAVADTFAAFLDRSPRPIIVFLNGRDRPGSGSAHPHGAWTESEIRGFWTDLAALQSETNRLLDRQALTFVVLARPEFKFPTPRRNSSVHHVIVDQPCLRLRRATVISRALHFARSVVSDPSILTQASIPTELTFLYAITLFRQSRPLAALCSWGVVKAPAQLLVNWRVLTGPGRDSFSASLKPDNDKIRLNNIVLPLVKTLTRLKVLRLQPGGFVWMHADVRSTLQAALENRYPVLTVVKSECHQGIADWYAKLFRCSQDPLAALESVRHRIACITHSRLAGPRAADIRQTALTEAVTLARLARKRLLEKGLYGLSLAALIATEKAVDDCLADLPEQENHGLSAWRHALGGEIQRFERSRDFQLTDFVKVVPLSTTETTTSPHPSAVYAATPDDSQAGNSKHSDDAIRALMGLRAYSKAEHHLYNRFCCAGLEAAIRVCTARRPNVAHIRAAANKWATQSNRTESQFRNLVWLSRQYHFLKMLVAQSYEHPNPYNRRRRAELVAAECLFALGTTLMRYCDDDSFLMLENARLRTNHAVLMANMGRFDEAYRRLAESSSYLSMSAMRDSDSSHGILELRRAEVALRQFEATWPARTVSRSHPRILSAGGLLRDAVAALDRAEHLLRAGRRRVWWECWLGELRLRSLEYELVLLSVQSTPFSPFEQRSFTERAQRAFVEASSLVLIDVKRISALALAFARVIQQARALGFDWPAASSHAQRAYSTLRAVHEQRNLDAAAYPVSKAVRDLERAAQRAVQNVR